ncbi:MAG TPA: glucose-6-phosphate dehydrogenase assembly protein OpcA, partial [Candidatus Binataceae bacterium]|nr:glucose-6-phosphate dehydrogenase assembly protein OpcA [Candidatus Binataceae bacterium]
MSAALTPVKPSEIEAALAALWRPAQAHGAVMPALTRACMSNLIVYCDDAARAAEVMEDLPHVVRSHPARVLTLIDDSEAGVPQAAVSTQRVSDDRGHQVVCEQVVLRARAVSLSSLARPLLLGDIPTSLWWAPPMAPPDGGRLFVDLARMADQVIYDSIDWHDPVAAMIATAGWASRPEILTAADLAWRRLKPWRRLLSQGLDPAVVPGALASLSEVEIEHGPHALPQAWLLMGW